LEVLRHKARAAIKGARPERRDLGAGQPASGRADGGGVVAEQRRVKAVNITAGVLVRCAIGTPRKTLRYERLRLLPDCKINAARIDPLDSACELPGAFRVFWVVAVAHPQSAEPESTNAVAEVDQPVCRGPSGGEMSVPGGVVVCEWKHGVDMGRWGAGLPSIISHLGRHW
jgi:hypothetical protein